VGEVVPSVSDILGEKPTDVPAVSDVLGAPPSHGVSDPVAARRWQQFKDPSRRLSFLDEVAIAEADGNQDEVRAYLQDTYGKDTLKQPKDPSALARLAADAPIVGGMMIGAGEGAEMGAIGGPWSAAAGAVGGGAIGAVAGKTLIEGKKALMGRYKKSPEQYADVLNETLYGGATAEMGGQVAGKVIPPLLKPVGTLGGKLRRWFTGTTPESEALTREVTEEGAVPPLSSTLPDMKRLQRIEELSRRIVGPPHAQRSANEAWVDKTLRRTLEKSGIPDTHLDAVMAEIKEPSGAMSTTELGEHIKSAVTAHKNMLEQSVEKEVKSIEAQVDEQMKHLTALTDRYEPGDLGVDVSAGISQARKTFATAANKLYERIDKLTGSTPIVPVDLIRREASALARRLPQSQTPGLVKEATQLNASGESSASLEAINRVAQEKGAGQVRAVIEPDGTVRPLIGVDAVDAAAREGQVIVQRGVGANEWTVLDRGGNSQNRINGILNSAKGKLDELAAANKPKAQAVNPDAFLLKEFGIQLPKEQGAKILLADAQRFRSILREKAASNDLTPGVIKGDLSRLMGSFDVAIDKAALDPVAAPAVKLLRQTNKWYGDNIAKFTDARINQIAKAADAGTPPNPEEIARLVIDPRNSARVSTIRKMLGEDTFRRVAMADWSRMVQGATDGATGQVTGIKLLRELGSRGDMLESIYGKETAGRMLKYAEGLAALDGKVSSESLSAGKMKSTMEALEAAQAKLDDFMKNNYLSALANPKVAPESAYRWIVKPGRTDQLRKAWAMFPEGTPQRAAIQQHAMKELAAQIETLTDRGKGKVGGELRDILNKYTKEQKEMLFPNGLDEDLNAISDKIEFVFSKLSDESMAGMAAGGKLGLPIVDYLWTNAVKGVQRRIVQNPSIVRALSLGLKFDSPATEAVMKGLVRDAIYEGVSDDGQDQQHPRAVGSQPGARQSNRTGIAANQ
jgi:hypothetical protein